MNEDPTSTTTMTDFYTGNGTLQVLHNTARGANQILALRQAILPVDGSVVWNVSQLPPPTSLQIIQGDVYILIAREKELRPR